MSTTETETLTDAPPLPGPFRLRATDVTGALEIEAEMQASVPAGAVARSLAQRMDLPSDVPWALRNDRGAFLQEERQIGEQVAAGDLVTLTPVTHLG